MLRRLHPRHLPLAIDDLVVCGLKVMANHTDGRATQKRCGRFPDLRDICTLKIGQANFETFFTPDSNTPVGKRPVQDNRDV
jgi:hypothetical protein